MTLSDTYLWRNAFSYASQTAYYLKNKDAVEAYLNHREELTESVKHRHEVIKPDLSRIHSHLLSQRNL